MRSRGLEIFEAFLEDFEEEQSKKTSSNRYEED